MDEKKSYWFEQPYMPRMKNIAVAPVILEDGRLSFCVPGDGGPPWSGVWNLTGKVVLNRDDYFEFQCDDEVMHRRGGSFMHWILLHSDGKPAGGYRMEKKLQTAVKQQKNCMSGI